MESRKKILFKLIQERFSTPNYYAPHKEANPPDAIKPENIAPERVPCPEELYDYLLNLLPPRVRKELWEEHLREINKRG